MGNTHLSRELIFKIDNALEDVSKSLNVMSAIWEEAEYEDPDLAQGILGPDYPFEQSLDDLAGDVRTWVGLCKGRLLAQLIEIVKKEESNG